MKLNIKKFISSLKILITKNLVKRKLHKYTQNGKKINVVFICHRPAIWNYQKSIFEACLQDNIFNVTILAIPNKKQLSDIGFSHEIYESEGAEEFFKDFPCRVINGYNYKTKEWFDIMELSPHYVFFQTPYNICRPKCYNSKKLIKYTQICYTHYGLAMLKDECVIKHFAQDFFQYAGLIFAETQFHKQLYVDEISKHNCLFNYKNIHLTGCTAFDDLDKHKNTDSQVWKHKDGSKYRVLWTPRWCTNENNCNFIEYKDFLFDYCENNDYDFVFRPHPQAFLNYEEERILTKEDIRNLITKYKNSKNCYLDQSKNYLETLYSSDVLVCDPSGIIFEYILTGKPIIYTKKSDDWANDFSKKVIMEGSYIVSNANELKNTLKMLSSGNDPLKEKRKQIIKDCFYINPKGAGYTIKELIKNDFKNIKRSK